MKVSSAREGLRRRRLRTLPNSSHGDGGHHGNGGARGADGECVARRAAGPPEATSAPLIPAVSSRGRCAAVNDGALVVKESQYSLHVICGVNELVSGPKFCSHFLAHLPFKYQYSHINFLATLDAQPPKLFFAECNLDDHNDTWCVPVDWSRPVGGQARCFYCESHGNRIIHPALSVFHGFNFEEAFFGPDTKSFYDNDQIIFFKSVFADWVILQQLQTS